MVRKDKVKIPKVPKNLRKLGVGLDRIELRHNMGAERRLGEYLPSATYVINAIFYGDDGESSQENIGYVMPFHSERGGYEVVFENSDKGPFEKTVIADQVNEYEGRRISLRAAKEIAQEIAEANHVSLEDKIDEDKLDLEIHALKWKRQPIFIISTLAGIALTAYSFSSSPTAYAVASVAPVLQNPWGLLGIFLFIFGVAGLVFGFNRKKIIPKSAAPPTPGIMN